MSTNTTPPPVPAPTVQESNTPAQIAAAEALMAELHKRTIDAANTLKNVPQGMVSDTVKL